MRSPTDSATLSAAADVKSFVAALLDGNNPGAPNTPPPNTPAEVVAYGGTFDPDYCHTQWVTGRTLQSGLTTTFPPNTKVLYTTGGQIYDVDFTSARIGPGTPQQTYRVVTARSYHVGGVNALLMDGSVTYATNSMTQATWRALGTRAGGEVSLVSGEGNPVGVCDDSYVACALNSCCAA